MYTSLRNHYGDWAVDAVRASNKGAHAHLEEAYGKGPEALDDLVKDARRLVDRMAAS